MPYTEVIQSVKIYPSFENKTNIENDKVMNAILVIHFILNDNEALHFTF